MKKAIEYLRGKKTYGIAVITLLYLAGVGLDWWEFSLAVLAVFGTFGLVTLRAGVKDEIRAWLDRMPLLAVCLAGAMALPDSGGTHQ